MHEKVEELVMQLRNAVECDGNSQHTEAAALLRCVMDACEELAMRQVRRAESLAQYLGT